MYLLSTITCLLAIDLSSALNIRDRSRVRHRQLDPGDIKEITVNLHPTAAKDLANFLNDGTSLVTCPSSMGGPDHNINIEGRQLRIPGSLTYRCLYGTGKAAVAAITGGHVLESMVKYSKDIIINVDTPFFKDPDIQKAFSQHLVAGMKMMQTTYPAVAVGDAYNILSAIFLAEHARFISHIEIFGYFSIAVRHLEREPDKCPTTTTGTVDCPNPLCDGKDGFCNRAGIFYACPCIGFICPDGDDVPYCDKCGGDNGSKKCKGLAEKGGKYKDCDCLITGNPDTWVFEQHGFYDMGPKIDKLPLFKEPLPEANPKCNDLLPPSPGNFVRREAALSAVGDYCNDPARLKVQGVSAGDLRTGLVVNAHYNPGDKDEMDLKMTWHQNAEISKDDCVKFLTDTIELCDNGDGMNPGGLKHGGAYTHKPDENADTVLVAEFIPSAKRFRNDCTPTDSPTWMYAGALAGAIEDFCPFAFDHKDEYSEVTYNSGKSNEVTLSLDWAKDIRDEITCRESFRQIKDGCGGSTLKHGPLGGDDFGESFKHGGVFIPKGRAYFKVSPKRNALCGSTPDHSCNDDKECELMLCPTGTSWSSATCQSGKCRCVDNQCSDVQWS